MRLSTTEVIVIAVLALEGRCTTKRLADITGISARYLMNIVLSLRKKGLVKSIRVQPFGAFLGLQIPNPAPSPKEKIHMLTKPLKELWQDPEFQRQASEIFDISDLNGLKKKLAELIKRRLSEKS